MGEAAGTAAGAAAGAAAAARPQARRTSTRGAGAGGTRTTGARQITGLEEGPPAPKEVTDEEMYELGLCERPPAPPPAPPPQPGQAAAGGMTILRTLTRRCWRCLVGC